MCVCLRKKVLERGDDSECSRERKQDTEGRKEDFSLCFIEKRR